MKQNRLSELLAPDSSWKGGFFVILKRSLSFLWPIRERSLVSEHNGRVDLVWQNGRLCLNQGEANYSFGNLHSIFQYIMAPLQFYNMHKVCILGFGAGSIYHILRNEKAFEGQICGVERDSVILELFRRAFPKPDHRLDVFTEDALNFLHSHSASTQNEFDFVFIDLFTGMEHSSLIYTQAFINAVKRICSKGANVYINCIFRPDEMEKKADVCLQWAEEFGSSRWIPVMNENEVLHVKNVKMTQSA